MRLLGIFWDTLNWNPRAGAAWAGQCSIIFYCISKVSIIIFVCYYVFFLCFLFQPLCEKWKAILFGYHFVGRPQKINSKYHPSLTLFCAIVMDGRVEINCWWSSEFRVIWQISCFCSSNPSFIYFLRLNDFDGNY